VLAYTTVSQIVALERKTIAIIFVTIFMMWKIGLNKMFHLYGRMFYISYWIETYTKIVTVLCNLGRQRKFQFDLQCLLPKTIAIMN